VKLADSALASLLLVQRLHRGDERPLSAGEYWSVVEQVQDPATLLSATTEELTAWLPPKVTPDRVLALIGAATAVAFELERLEQVGIRPLTPFDDTWPARLQTRLGRAAPAVLFCAGPTSLLAVDGLGIVGSRNVDEAGAEVARSAAQVAVDASVPVVSGGARGVDQLSMAAAADAGGTTVGILADSLTKALRNADTRRTVLDGVACLATPFAPDAGFSAGNAMARNKIVYGLSRLTLVVASDADTGGTWAGATEALKKDYGRVAAWSGPGEGPGNAALAQLGANPVTTMDELAARLLEEPTPTEPVPVTIQQSLL
jgi:predicted Rossmann fold nucleotide-binding protein DprA/Smf involved in DNA uptake